METTTKTIRYRDAQIERITYRDWTTCRDSGFDVECTRVRWRAMMDGERLGDFPTKARAQNYIDSFYGDDRTPEFRTAQAAAVAVDENNDCAVKAVAIATGTDYATVRALLRNIGRRDGHGTQPDDYRYAIRRLGFIARPYRSNARTVRAAASMLPANGVFLVRVSGHVLCVRDGRAHDWNPRSLRRIVEILEITKSV